MRRNITLLAIIICLASPAMAKEYRFATLEFPPLEYRGDDGEATGIAVDIVRKIMTNLGHTVEIGIYPWARALRMTKDGDADAVFTAYKNPEREKFLDYSKHVLIPQVITFYVNKDSDIAFSGDLMELKGRKIGIVNTISYGKRFDEARKHLDTEVVQNRESNFKKLKANRIDMVVSNIYVGDSTIKRMGMQGEFKKLSPAVQSVDSFIGFSKANGLSQLRDDFDRELGKMKEDGTYKEIIAKYGVKPLQ